MDIDSIIYCKTSGTPFRIKRLCFLNSIKHFDFSELQMFEGLPPGIGGAQSSLLGMQLGNIAGFLSKNTWGLSHFGIILPRNSSLAINLSLIHI